MKTKYLLKVTWGIVIRKGKTKLNLFLPYDYAWGDKFVAVSSETFVITKSGERFLQISIWAKNLIMDETPRVFIVVEYCWGGLRAGSYLFFCCSNLFLGIINTCERLGYWRDGWCLCIWPTIVGFSYARASDYFVLNSLLICKSILWFYNKI